MKNNYPKACDRAALIAYACNRSIPTLRNGLTVAFEDITYSRDAFGIVSVHGFVVVIGNTFRFGAATLYETDAAVYAEVSAMAHDAAEDMSDAEYRHRRDLRAWLARQ